MRDFLPWILGNNPTARIDVSPISLNAINLPAGVLLDYIRASDETIEFYKEKKGEISDLKYKDYLSLNVDDGENFIYRYLLDRYEKVFLGYPSGQFANLIEYITKKEIYPCLKKIYAALENHRNGKIIIGVKKLANCDICIPDKNIIVELSEVRHFTELRALALKYYPKELTIAFDKEEYLNFCDQIKAKDDDSKKPYRDEQRAWYDTLRDFLPLIDGKYRPVIRIPLFETKKPFCD